ncbi:unnamed protein product [Anisakis simplex]|uniref:Protein disulfide-isomerase A5 (inferred by orthology to a human protein) n=1 Tax=Anisakis simplex TaxID=6269 RepID=A0A0M3JRH6_ANISI|nr:unnamed protein product [Anisakis simplex]
MRNEDASVKSVLNTFSDAADKCTGIGTFAMVDCSADKESKKLCKKLKIEPNPYTLRHYHNGEYRKEYDRQLTSKSITRFMNDPTGDIPWDEDPSSANVVHIENRKAFTKLLAMKRPTLVMFYAPWCGHCKRLKPEYCEAANELNGKFILAAVDATQSSNEYVVQKFNVEGYPTLHYFENGQHKFRFTGLNTKEGIMAWLKNPTEKPLMEEKKTEEKPWSEIPSEVVHLDDEKFDAFMASHSSVLVMFYAPWCGHCNKAKPEYMAAAEMLKKDKIDGVLAAVDATVHRKAAEKVGVEGFPTFAYYKKGKYSWKVNERTKDGFYKFMKNPVEPPSEDSGWSAEDSSVLHLVGDNFKSELKKKRDALVMFYAPCERQFICSFHLPVIFSFSNIYKFAFYCKRTKPFYWEAARQLSDESRIALAAVDCSVETSLCSDFGIKGFPTIIYLSYGKNRLDYHGRYDNAQAFVDFVKQAGHKDYSWVYLSNLQFFILELTAVYLLHSYFKHCF